MNNREMIKFFDELFNTLIDKKVIKNFGWGFNDKVEIFDISTLDNKIFQFEFDYKTKKIKKTITIDKQLIKWYN